MIDVILGYVSGLWDGLMEAVIGLLELVALALRLLGAFVSAAHDLDRIVNVTREVGGRDPARSAEG